MCQEKVSSGFLNLEIPIISVALEFDNLLDLYKELIV